MLRSSASLLSPSESTAVANSRRHAHASPPTPARRRREEVEGRREHADDRVEEEEGEMSHMKGDLLTKTRRLVKGLAKKEPLWLKAMEQAPPATFPRVDGKLQAISLPEDVYVQKFFRKHPDSKHEEAIKINSCDPVPARVFAWRVLELKEQGVAEADAISAADMEYRVEKRGKKQAYARLKQIAKIQGKKPPPNPYPSAIREIQAEERKYIRDRFFHPQMQEILQKLWENKAADMERFRPGGNTS